MTTQIETATIAGTVTVSGNALITVTASGMTNSPKAVSVAVTAGQTAADVAQAARYALAIDTDVARFFFVSGTGADVVLTARVDAANDTTMNIASANGTCAGLTDTPTSANTRAGAAVITNGYCTLDEIKAWARVYTTDTVDDSVIVQMIESASRFIDIEAQRVFYPTTETRLFDMPKGDTLYFDKDLLALTTLTNGNGDVITSAQYALLPANETPKYAVKILPSTSIAWKSAANGNTVQCISVLGSWGETCPPDILEACAVIVKAAYNRRFGENMTSVTTVTQSGLVVTPEDVPAKALQMIHNRRRTAFA